MQLTRHAIHAEAVGAVGCDLQLQDLRGDRQHVRERSPRREVGARRQLPQHHDAVVIGADRKLVLGEDHPLRGHAAQLRLLQLRPIGHDRPRARDRHVLPRCHVGGAADNPRGTLGPGGAEIDLAYRQAIGVGMALGRKHATHDEVLELAHAVMVNRLHLSAGHRQPLLHGVNVQAGVAVLTQPCQRYAHQPNCLKNRKSFSYKSRRSGTPYINIAALSTPNPHANP